MYGQISTEENKNNNDLFFPKENLAVFGIFCEFSMNWETKSLS